MTSEALTAVAALNRRFLLDYPHEAARRLEAMSTDDVAALLAAQPAHAAVRTWQALGSDVARGVLESVPDALARQLLTDSEPIASAAVLAQLEPDERETRLGTLDSQIAQDRKSTRLNSSHSSVSRMPSSA